MPWTLKAIENKVFSRNTLAVVMGQLRFHPILLIRQKEGIGAFQMKIRKRFPRYAETATNVIVARPDHSGSAIAFDAQQEPQYIFSTEDDKTRIVLGTDSLSVENKAHEDRRQLIEDIELAISVLRKVYGALSAARLGLRYINLISKERIEKDLNRALSWKEIISGQFVALPDVVDLDGTLFYSEITSSVKSDGALTLRHGLLKDQENNSLHFRIDADRYINGAYDIDRTRDKLMSFSDDIFAMFMTAAGPALLEWMNNQGSSP